MIRGLIIGAGAEARVITHPCDEPALTGGRGGRDGTGRWFNAK